MMETQWGRDPSYRSNALKAAKDFGYGDEIIAKIKMSKSDNEIAKIMKEARHAKFK